ncbi:tetratricopeptide repeat protein [Floridanema evergladense]|uniref:Tetratricopeptide repeat protein n=1 Tax=Floridaenema evergladense BLCC-F167 TaxID=3153639 RepID=A0ABV4WS04_9CYAN
MKTPNKLILPLSVLAAVVVVEHFSISQGKFILNSAVVAQTSINQKAEADRLLQQGNQQYQKGQFPDALKSFEQALNIYRQIGDRQNEATTLIKIGDTYLDYIEFKRYYNLIEKPEELKPYSEVLKYYEQGLVIMRKIGDRKGEALTLNGIGRTNAAINKKEEALNFYEQALTIMREVKDKTGEATVLFNIGKDYDWGFDRQRDSKPISIDFYEQALRIVREIGDRPLEAKILYTIGFTYKNKGQEKPEIALEYYKQALPIARELGDRILEEKVLNNMGYTYRSLGYSQIAQEHQEQALAIRQGMNIHVAWPTDIIKKAILITYNTPKKRPTLITFLEGEALIHYRNGEAHASRRRYQAALESYQQALAIVRQQRNRPWQWVILNQMATIYETLGQFEAALDSYKQSLNIRTEVDELAAKEPIPYSIRVAYGTDVNVHIKGGIKLEDAISNGLIKIGEGEPINTAITTFESFITPEEIAVMEKRGRRLEVVAGIAGWQSFTENEEEDTLANMGDIYKALGDYQTALNSYRKAWKIIRAELDSKESEETRWRRVTTEGLYYQQELRIFRSMGEVYAALGEHKAALEAYQKALEIATKEKSGSSFFIQIPILLIQMGKAYENLGQYQAALEVYQKVLAIAQDPKNKGNYSTQEHLIRQFGQEEYFRQTRIPYEKPDREAILNSIGAIYEKLGQTQKAQEYRQQALALKREISDRTEEDITAQKAILITEVGRDEAKKAIVQIHRLEGEAVALFAAGNSYFRQGQYLKAQYQLALESYQKALAIVRQQNNRPWERVILIQMGLVYEQLEQNQAALEQDQQALAIGQEIEKPAEKATLLSKIPLSGSVNFDEVKIGFESGKITTFKPEGGVIFFAQTREKLQADRLLKEGITQYVNGKYERALKSFEAALSIYQKLEDKPGVAKSFFEIGEVYEKREEDEQALNHYQQALELYRELGDRSGEKTSLNLMSGIYYKQGIQFANRGQYRESLKRLEQVLEIAQKLGHLETELRTFLWMARVYSSLGEYKLALDYYQKALPIRQEILGHWEGIESNIGRIYEVLGQYELALKYYEEALKTARFPTLLNLDGSMVGDIAGEANALNAIGNIHYRLSRYESALNYHQQALTVLKKVKNQNTQKLLEATTYNSIGFVYLKQGKYQLALDFLQPALAIYQQFNRRRAEGVVLHAIGKLYFEQGQYELAGNYLQRSLVIAQEIGNKEGEGHTLSTIAYLLEKQNQPELAIVFFKQSVNARETIRKNIKELPKEHQQSYIETVAKDYRKLADLLLQKDRILEAQQVLDLLKLQELDNYLRNVRGNEQTARGVSNTPQEQEVKQGYEAIVNKGIKLGKELAELQKIPVDKRTSAQQQRILELRKAEQEITKEFTQFLKSPTVTALVTQLRQVTGGENLNLKDFNSLRDNLQRLQTSAVILYPFILDDRLELILVTPYSPPIRRTVNVKREELNRVIAEFHLNLKQPNSNVIPVANKLYEWLIKPIENDLAEAKTQTIIYAPDGQLRYIPLAALHDGKQWLVERFGINYITAASLTDFNTKPQGKMQIFAGAFSEGSYSFKVGEQEFQFSGLPFAGKEVENLAATIPGTTKFLNGQFNRDTVLMMNDFSVVHLATHAAFVVGNPEDSFIMFGNGDRATLRDVESWSLPKVDLIVLSACETGVGGKLGNGEEILGFGFQMQRTGARAAIASLWPVSDGGTQVLINGFYSLLQKGNLSKAEALRQAQIALITGNHSAFGEQRGIATAQAVAQTETSKLNHPYYWAPFILIGNGL